jgi:outer membrane protein OmpA-like peptidoglycan-associated protein
VAGQQVQQVRCPLCRLEPDETSRCPDCGQDLAPLVHVAALPALSYNRALEQAAAGDDDGAAGSLRLALQEDEGFAEAWTVLGKIHARNGRTEEARSAWKRALDVVPGHQAAQEALAALAAVEAARADDAAAAGAAQAQADQQARRRSRLRKVLAAVGALLVVALLTAVAVLANRPSPPPPAPPAPPPPVTAPTPPPPTAVTVAARGPDLVMGGTVGEPATRQAYVAAAAAAAGYRRLVDVLAVDAEAPAAPGPDADVVRAVVGLLAAAPPGDRLVVLTGSRLVLSGTVPDESARRALVEQFRQVQAGTKIDDQLVVDPAGAAADVERVNRTLQAVQDTSPILFKAGAEITPQGDATVALVAEYLRREPPFRVRVEGHSAGSSGGVSTVARTVSEDRARVVLDRLAAAGIDPSRVTVQGLGDRSPLDTTEASRRVTISVEG